MNSHRCHNLQEISNREVLLREKVPTIRYVIRPKLTTIGVVIIGRLIVSFIRESWPFGLQGFRLQLCLLTKREGEKEK